MNRTKIIQITVDPRKCIDCMLAVVVVLKIVVVVVVVVIVML